MPQHRKTTQMTLRNNRQNTIDDSSVDEEHPLTLPPTTKKRHPGQPSLTKHPTPSQVSDSVPTNDEEIDSPTHSSNNTNNKTMQHKVVNSKSKNRRQCKRASDDLSRSTPDQNNLTLRKHTNLTRLTLKLTCPSSDNVETKLISLFTQFFQELISADPTAAIIPWKSVNRLKGPIAKTADIPSKITSLRTYLHKFYMSRTPDTQFVTYPSIHIGHDASLADIREEMQTWFREGEHGLYYKMLQVEDSTEIGWFLYSTKEMDAGALVDEIGDLVGIKIGLRWKIIDVGAKGKLPESQRIRALVIEVNSRTRWDSQRALINYFGRTIGEYNLYPNGIRLRFVKNKKDGINAIEKGKIEKLRARQKAFLNNIVSTETNEIIQLDYSSEPNEPTLRQMIMSLTTEEDIPLFHCVDLDWKGDRYIFQYSPDVKVEAECTINTLIPILKHRFPNVEIEKNFSSEAIERCEGYKFDVNKGVIVDNLIDEHLTFVDEENLLGFSFSTSQEVVEINEATRPVSNMLFNDSDSVSTFAKPGQTFMSPNRSSSISASRNDNRSNDNTSVTSNTSTVTMDTIYTLENRLNAITTHISNNDKKFDELMQFLRSTKAGGQATPTTAKNGASNSSHTKAGDNSSVSGNVL